MSTTFTTEGYAERILQKLWKRRENQKFSDVVLIDGSEKKRIPAHRSVLREASEYFYEMFKSSQRESTSKFVEMPDVNGDVLQSLAEYCYKGSVLISEDNVVELLKTAHMLQLGDVVTACANFLIGHLHSSNCLRYALLAEKYNCVLLVKKAKEYSLEHIVEISETSEFLQLSVEQLSQLLACDGQRTVAEEDVFNSLKAWFEHDPIERERNKVELLKLVRMTLLERTFLIQHVKPICTSLECLRIYLESIEYHPSYDSAMPSGSNLTKPRKLNEVLMGITYEQFNKMFIQYYCPQQNKWKKLLKELEYRQFSCTVLFGNCLYIIGGFNVRGIVSNTVICLDLDSMILIEKSLMTLDRSGFCAAELNGLLYVLGGHSGSNFLNSAEKFNPETNKWVKVANMSVARCYAGCAVLNKKLYVVGGSSNATSLSSAECYNPDQDIWQSIVPMGESRQGHGVTVANGLLYAVGGWGTKTAERYDPQTNKWTFICSLRDYLPKRYSCTTLNDKVVISCGGRFEEYDAVANEWKEMKSVSKLNNLCRIFSYSGKLPASEFVEK